jgi:hypothetical protein
MVAGYYGVMRSKGMARTYRLLLGFIAPPIFGSILFLIFAIVPETMTSPINMDRIFEYIAQFHVVIFFALIFIGAQSFAFSLIMEFIVRPKFLGLRYFLLISCVLGFLSGFIPGVLVDDLGLFLPVGLLVGVFVGLLIYDRSNEIRQGCA